MKAKSTPQPLKPVVTYPSLVGRILAQQREARGIKQGELAAQLGLSQSAYSRLESGESVLNLSQLRNVAAQLGLQPSQVLKWADQYEAQLRQQGVDVVAEKQDHTAAIAIGFGLLAALLLGGK
ncbi:helix-turn-helix domain-containing protein [Ampullimonas aquatilis]|uniref:helix-turn-helix domain-containing protein n=1 Tax=Ampullimonas aquatilis TaxID=1341549 RepID=UPI003C791774